MERIKALLALAAAGAGMAWGQGAYPGWTHTAPIVVNTTPEGAGLPDSAVLTDFPLLVRLENGNFDFSQAKPGGQDIRFSSSGDAPLAYEIEHWDAGMGKAALWVKVPSIRGNSLQTLRLHWGKADAASESDGAAVFGTAAGYTGVWHLAETPGNGPDGFKDATANAAHGTGVLMEASSGITGVIGRAVDFQREKQQHIAVKNEALFDYAGQATVSLWFKVESLDIGWQNLVSKGDHSWRITRDGTSDRVGFHMNGPGGVTAPVNIHDGKWHHVAGVLDKGIKSIYIDGQLSASEASGTAINQTNDPLWIGNNSNIPKRWFDGILDEVQVSGAGRSRHWVRLSYESQRPDQVTVAPPKAPGCVKAFGAVADTLLAAEGVPFSVHGRAACADRFHWVEVDGNGKETFLDGGLNFSRLFRRIPADTVLRWRLKARYGAAWETDDVTVTVKDRIPNPSFTLTAGIPDGQAWNGRDSVALRLEVANGGAIAALDSPYNVIDTAWSFGGARVYKTFTDKGVVLRRAYEPGTVEVEVCLDNGGEKVCRKLAYPVSLPAAVSLQPFQGAAGKLKVFVLAGQSNMEGYGRVRGTGTKGSLDWLLKDPQYAGAYQHLVDGNGAPRVYEDAWVYYPRELNYALQSLAAGPLAPRFGVKNDSANPTIGPEYGMGIHLDRHFGEPVLLIKTSWGGHSLGEKFRPPGRDGKAGPSYVRMLQIVEEATANLKKHFPGYRNQGWELAGLGWHQGFNDQFCAGCKTEYALNLATLIDDVRRAWNTPRLPVVIGESGMLCNDAAADDICKSQALVPSFRGFQDNVAFAATRQFYKSEMGDGAGYHWYESFWSYYHVGDEMGKAIVSLLKKSVPAGVPPSAASAPGFGFEAAAFPDHVLVRLRGARSAEEYQVTVSDVRGRELRTYRFHSHVFRIPRAGLPGGMKQIRVTGGGRQVTRKVILF